MKYLLILFYFFSFKSFAYEIGIVSGVHFSNPRFEPSLPASAISGDTIGQIGGQAGVLGNFELGKKWTLRSGAEIGYRNLRSAPLNYHFLSFDVPLYVQYSIIDEIAVFIGPKILFNLYANCDGQPRCEIGDGNIPELSLPLVLGVNYRFSKTVAIEAFYEKSTLPILDLKGEPYTFSYDMNTFGINFIYFY